SAITRDDPTVGIPSPLRLNPTFISASYMSGQILVQDRGLALIHIGVAYPGKMARDYSIADIATDAPRTGDRVFLFGGESGDFPSFRLHEGVVTRITMGSM